MQKETEISSSVEYLHKRSNNSLVNQMNLTLNIQVAREWRTHTRRRMIWKKKGRRVTKSQSPPLYSLDQGAASMRAKRTGNFIVSVWKLFYRRDLETIPLKWPSHKVTMVNSSNNLLKKLKPFFIWCLKRWKIFHTINE